MAGQTMILSNSPAGVKLLEQNQQGLTLKVQLGKVDFYDVSTDKGAFTLLTAEGLARSQDIGKPDLPTANRLLAIPFGCELETQVIDYQVEEYSLADLGITNPIMPAQASISKSQDPTTVSFEYDSTVYAKAGYYRQLLSEAKTVGIMRSINIGLVVVAPFEYDPTQNKLRVYKEITIRVNYIHPDWALTDQMTQKYYSPAFEPVYGALMNYEGYNQQSMITTDLTKYPIKYLIISDRMFQSQLQPFIQWKIKRGFKVITAYTDSIGTTTTAIKNYIQGIYQAGTPQDPAPSFVLLVGDAQQIPAFSFTSPTPHISDLSYFEYTGDNIPEIYYGRFSAQNTTELQPQIDKTLEYERYLMPDPSYLGRVTMIGGMDASYGPVWANGQINYGTTYYFNASHGLTSNTYLYPNSGGQAAAIRQTVNTGVGYINYTAHGSHDGWADPQFTTAQVNALTNSHKYPLAVGNCCQTVTFGTDYSTPSVGETWLQAANKGAIGYIGASDYSYWNEDYWWGCGWKTVVLNPVYDATRLGAYDGIFHDHSEPLIENYIYNDAINFRGNLAVTQANGSRTAYYWQIYHLLGDPSVMTYFRVPSANTVTHASTILISATSFTVQALAGSYAGISFNGVLKGAAYVGTSGSVDIPVTAMGTPGTVDIVVTAQNRIPYISTIQAIAPSGPFIVYDSHSINDSLGNNNGLVDNGESIILGVQLKNVGPNNGQNIVATLSELDSYVTVTDNSESYGTITGNNGIVNRPRAFAFNTLPGTPDGHIIAFQLNITGTALDTWTGNFNVPVHAPVIGYVSVVVNDASGNNNGVLDPGETANLVITLQNTGSTQAVSVIGTLSESDVYVTVPDYSGTFGNIAPSGTTNNSGDVFRVTASSSCPMEYAMTFNLQVSATGGYVANLNVPLMIGVRGVIYSDDFSINRGWSGLGSSGEWTIGAATGGSGTEGGDTYGGPDPSTDHSPTSDNKLLGNDLTSGTGGDYSPSLTSTDYATSPIINCANYTGVQLTFYRWLGVERNQYDHAYLQAFNGSSWVTLFANDTTTINESSWSQQFYNLSTIADHNAVFRIRFGIGTTDGSWQYCGWNIDDIEIKGYNQTPATFPRLSYTPASLGDSLVQGDIANSILKVTNTGTGTLQISFGSTDSWLSLDDSIYQVAPAETLRYTVTFNSASMATPGTYHGNVSYTSNDTAHTTGNIPATLLIYAPDLSLSQTAFSDTVNIGETSNMPLILINNGPGRLNWDIVASVTNPLRPGGLRFKPAAIIAQSQPAALGHKITDAEKVGGNEPYFPPVAIKHGGPDQFGYRWTDSDDSGGPAVTWVDISGNGTPVNLTDDSYSGPIAIGFSFPFYENSYSELYIGSNGIITFGAGSPAVGDIGLPNPAAPNNIVAIWWDDLNPGAGGNIYYRYDASGNRFIVSFVGVPNFRSSGGTGALSFQAILYPSGKISFNYNTMNPGLDNLTGASIGIENSTGTDGLEVVYNAAFVHNQLSISFTNGSWLSVSPAAGYIGPHSRDTVLVSLDAGELAVGTYTGQLILTSNDLEIDSLVMPVILRVEGGQSGCDFMPGDINGDRMILGGDITYAVRYFKMIGLRPADSCWNDSTSSWLYSGGDVNGNCEFRGSDVTLFVTYFKGIADHLCYCPQTPPLSLRNLRPGWIWDKGKNQIRKDISQRINSSSLIKKIE
jgi:hypothetical protein